MKDPSRINPELIEEIAILKQRIKELEQSDSESNRAEALIRGKVKWERTFDAIPDLIALIDKDHRIIRANGAMAARLGCTPEQVEGCYCYEAVHGLSAPPDFCPHAKLLTSGEEAQVEAAEERLGGIFNISTTPLRNEAGQLVGSIHVARDITDLKQAEEALHKAHDELEIRVRERTTELLQANKALQAEISERKRAEAVLKESEGKYNRFFRTSRDCVFITSKDGRWIDLNDAAVELFGYSSREELMQVKIPNLYANQEERAKHISIIAECGFTKELPVDLRRKDGTVIQTLITSVARYDAEGNVIGYQGTIRDITDRRRMEEEKEKLILELRHALSEIKTLSGLLPICASCKKIRDDNGYWNQIESYIKLHSEAEFSHSICPECAKKLYPEHYKEVYPEYDK